MRIISKYPQADARQLSINSKHHKQNLNLLFSDEYLTKMEYLWLLDDRWVTTITCLLLICSFNSCNTSSHKVYRVGSCYSSQLIAQFLKSFLCPIVLLNFGFLSILLPTAKEFFNYQQRNQESTLLLWWLVLSKSIQWVTNSFLSIFPKTCPSLKS